ncbi:MAG: SsrA-binding protein, partial [Bacilli bacterium]|nr:SsrA-binding protein [Bacilli bacterium]
EGNIFNHDPDRTRKLLLHKKEILKLKTSLEQEGLTLIPLKLFFKGNKLKVILGVCKGKKLYDKRESIKEKDQNREANKLMKNNYRA